MSYGGWILLGLVVYACLSPSDADSQIKKGESDPPKRGDKSNLLPRYQLPAVPRELYILPQRPRRYEPMRGCRMNFDAPKIPHIRPSAYMWVVDPERAEAIFRHHRGQLKLGVECERILPSNPVPRSPMQKHIPTPSLSGCHTVHSRPDVLHPY